MSKVALVVDNSAYLTDEEIKKYDVKKVVPISFIVNGEEFYEGVNMTYSDFYNFLQDKKTSVGTSQPSIENIKIAWREVLKDYDQIVYIILSSGLSGACNNAINASHEEEFLDKVFVVNDQRVSYMSKFSVAEAHFMIEQGKSGNEIKEFLEETKSDCGVYIAVDTLTYLKKGGRITAGAAAIGTMLNIKPILQIHGGKLDKFAKTMSMKTARIKMIEATRKEVEEKFPEELKQGKVYIGMAHSMADLKNPEIESFEHEVRDAFPDMKIFRFEPLPLFIVCHTGPGSLACGYLVDRLGIVENDCK